MTALEWGVIAGGIALIAWVNWYFFLAERSSSSASVGTTGMQEVVVAVKGGYEPATIHLRHGVPARLLFDRQETSPCSEEVVIPDLGIRAFLPPHRRTPIEFTPAERGRHEFTCGMSMLRGTIVVD